MAGWLNRICHVVMLTRQLQSNKREKWSDREITWGRERTSVHISFFASSYSLIPSSRFLLSSVAPMATMAAWIVITHGREDQGDRGVRLGVGEIPDSIAVFDARRFLPFLSRVLWWLFYSHWLTASTREAWSQDKIIFGFFGFDFFSSVIEV